jgi:hypothetical protein
MQKLLGSARAENCHRCHGSRQQRVISVLSSRIVMKCAVCGAKNVRKIRRLK